MRRIRLASWEECFKRMKRRKSGRVCGVHLNFEDDVLLYNSKTDCFEIWINDRLAISYHNDRAHITVAPLKGVPIITLHYYLPSNIYVKRYETGTVLINRGIRRKLDCETHPRVLSLVGKRWVIRDKDFLIKNFNEA